MLTYLDLDDLYNHGSLIDPYFIGLTLSTTTKRTHSISGWYSIAGIHGNHQIEPICDIWCGFDDKFKSEIEKHLFFFCNKIGVNYK